MAKARLVVRDEVWVHAEGAVEVGQVHGEPMPPVIDVRAAACPDQAMVIAERAGVDGTSRLTRSGDPIRAICEAARIKGAGLVGIRQAILYLANPCCAVDSRPA